MIQILSGFGISLLFGYAGTFVVLMALSIAFPALFRLVWYTFMFPVFLLSIAGLGWVVLPAFGIGSWSESFFSTMMWPSLIPTIWLCSPAGVGPSND